MYSIRVKIIAVTIAAILASVLVLGGIGMIKVKQESERSSVERMSTTCMTLQQKLNVYLGSLEQSVQMGIHIAEDSLEGMDMALFSSSLTAEQKEQLDTALAAHTAEVEHAFSSIAENTQGVVTYYYCINDDLGSSEHGFFLDATQGNGFIRRDPLISSDDPKYGGLGRNNTKSVKAEDIPCDRSKQSIVLDVPPLSVTVMKYDFKESAK